jgi:hypothetical protein
MLSRSLSLSGMPSGSLFRALCTTKLTRFRLLPIISLFPPATLSVTLNTYTDQIIYPIRVPGLFNRSTPVGAYSSSSDGDLPIEQLEQDIFTSNAVIGDIKRPIDLKFGTHTYANYSYSASVCLPRLRCITQSVTELDPFLRNATEIWLSLSGICDGCPRCQLSMDPVTWSLHNCLNETHQMHGFYFALTPLADFNNPHDNLVPSIPDFGGSDGNLYLIVASEPSDATISNCTAINSTVDFRVNYVDGIPTITTDNIVDYGPAFIEPNGYVVNVMDYSAVSRWFNGIFGWLGGYRAFYDLKVAGSTGSNYYKLGAVQGTVLRFAKDYYRATKAMVVEEGTGMLIELAAPSVVRNMTFAQMLEELSLNISLSYMSQDLLRYVYIRSDELLGDQNAFCSYGIPTKVQISSTKNTYVYQPRNLWLSYGSGIFVTLISIIIGMISYMRNGVHLENKASTIGALMQHESVAQLLRGKANTGLGRQAEMVEMRLDQTFDGGIEFVPKG